MRRIYELGLSELRSGKKLGQSEFGLVFIIPFSISVARSGEFKDDLDWVSFEDLSPAELKSAAMLVRPLLKSPERKLDLYEGKPDYHARLYPIWSWQKRFTGQETAPPSARIGMLKRPIRKDRAPIPRKYLRQDPSGWSFRGGYNRHYSPMACAVDLVRLVVTNGLDENGEPIDPPNGYLSGPDGD